MKKLATCLVAVGALALLFVSFGPSSAEAGWRRWGGGWGGPGVGVYVGPRYAYSGYGAYGYYGYPYRAYSYGYYPYAYYPYWRGRHWYRRNYGWY